jgi:hypothetical protein
MFCLFHMTRFNIWNIPNVAWVFPERIPAPLPLIRSLIVSLTRILLRYTNGIEIKEGHRTLGIPQYSFVATTEAICSVGSMPESPNDPIF